MDLVRFLNVYIVAAILIFDLIRGIISPCKANSCAFGLNLEICWEVLGGKVGVFLSTVETEG